MSAPELLEKVVYYLAFLFSVTLHEAAHAWAAKRGGDLTAYRGGQVSLDPVPHIRREPFGMVILPVLTVLVSGWPFGFASAPYDPTWAERHPRRAAWMSLAGPAANLALIMLCAVAIRAGMIAGVFQAPASVGFGEIVRATPGTVWIGAGLVLGVLFSLNLVLFVLNMLPLPPLDGSGAIPLLLTPDQTRSYRRFLHQPMLGIFGILIAWQLFDLVFRPIFLGAVNVLYVGVASYG